MSKFCIMSVEDSYDNVDLIQTINEQDEQISDLERLNSLYLEQDSLRCKEIEQYKNAYEDSYDKYNRLNKRYKVYKTISFSSISS